MLARFNLLRPFNQRGVKETMLQTGTYGTHSRPDYRIDIRGSRKLGPLCIRVIQKHGSVDFAVLLFDSIGVQGFVHQSSASFNG